MSSKREQVAQALLALIVAACPFAKVERNAEKPANIPAGGYIILRDGDPGQPEVTLSPLSYTYEHDFGLELAGSGGAPASVVDALMVAIGAAVRANRTLGGLCEFVEAVAPFVDTAAARGTDTLPWADAGLTAIYETPDPL